MHIPEPCLEKLVAIVVEVPRKPAQSGSQQSMPVVPEQKPQLGSG